MSTQNSQISLSDSVLKNDLCIACGACSYVAPKSYQIGESELGFFRAEYCGPDSSDGNAARVCPFHDSTRNEDEISASVFPNVKSHDHRIGRFLRCYAGRVADDDLFQKSSSGGIARWLLARLLDEGLIDGVATVFASRPEAAGAPLFEYRIVHSSDEVKSAARSAYYPVTMDSVLKQIHDQPGRYAITGVPCFIKAVRNLCEVDSVLRDRIRFTIGVVCGHLKGRFYAELLGWQLGIHPDDLGGFDFRKKIPGRLANQKGVVAFSRANPECTGGPEIVQNLYGTNYGEGFFKYRACDFCDDVLAETADIAIGDAWLPEYLQEGTSLVITRSAELDEIITNARESGDLMLDDLSAELAAKSQDAGLRHRRVGLQHRLQQEKNKGRWAPRKRVEANSSEVDSKYREIIELRSMIQEVSPKAFLEARKCSNLKIFYRQMRKIKSRYADLYQVGVLRRLLFSLGSFFGIEEERILRKAKKILRR